VRVAVVGAGGIGSYFGGRLARTGDDIHLLARGQRLRAIRDNGLRISGVRGEFAVAVPATDDPADVGPCDIVLFCVKSYDTDGAVDLLPPLLHATTAVVSLQNGVDNEEKIAARIGPEHVLGGAAFIFASVVEPGVVHDAGGPGSLLFGELDGSRSARGEALLAMCEKAGIPAEFVTNIRVRLWDKFAFICAQAGMTACTRLPIGEVRAEPVTWAMFTRIVDEVIALSMAEGVDLPRETGSKIARFAQALPAGGFSSLYDDLVGGRRLELEALHGFVVQRSRAHGLPAPMCEAVYALLKAQASSAKR
jgi:2-dehydropantoate 2-reductase